METDIDTDDKLIDALKSEGAFGVSAVQRKTRWGYNRAARKVEELLEQKRIQQVDGVPYRYILSSTESVAVSKSHG